MLDHYFEVLAKEAEFAPGIPHKTVKHPIPAVKRPDIWQFGLHEHHSEGGAGLHFDLRLGHPASGHAHSWAMKHWPKPGEARLAVQQPTHTIKYMDFQGRIESGYGKGQVNLARRDRTEITSSNQNHVRFNLYTGKGQEEYLLHRMDGDQWLLHNTTVTRDGKAAGLPDSKPKYKSKKIDQLDPHKADTVWQAKIDGAHATFAFDKPGQQARVFSYRPTERETGIIEHTQRLPDHTNLRVPRALRDSVLRGELYATDRSGRALEPARVGGLLNASVWKSRQKQEAEGKLRPVVFDVVRWKGRDVEHAPYDEKLEMLREAVEAAPWLALPRMAHTPEEKRKLLEDIGSGKEPSTREGIVEWNLGSGGPPSKAKFLDEKDVIVRNIFAEQGKKRSGTMAGGFEFSYTKDGPIVGRVGTGMSHAMKKDMLASPSKYEGLTARILMQRAAERYAPRAPKFYGFHPDQELPHDIKTAACHAMAEELLKIALPRWAREWQAAEQAGNVPAAEQIGQASHQLGLPSRKVKELGGGAEQLSHVRVGGQFGNVGLPPAPGVHTMVAKEMMPDSPFAQGPFQKQLLQQRHQAAQAAAKAGGPAAAHMAQSYGHGQLPGGGHVSGQEYVRGTSLRKLPQAEQAGQLANIKTQLQNPLRKQGIELHDIQRSGFQAMPGEGVRYGVSSRTGASNVIVTPQGQAKVVDAIPEVRGVSAPHAYYQANPTAQVQHSRYMDKPNALRAQLYRGAELQPAARGQAITSNVRSPSAGQSKPAPVSALAPTSVQRSVSGVKPPASVRSAVTTVVKKPSILSAAKAIGKAL